MLNIFTKNHLCLDIGSRNIKLAKLIKKGKNIVIKKLASESFSSDIDPDSKEFEISASTTIKNLLKTSKIRASNINIVISGDPIIIRQVIIPYMSETELKNNLKFEAAPFLAIDTDKVELRYHIIDTREIDKKIMLDILIIAVRKTFINSIISILKNAGLTPNIIDIDAFTTGNLLHLNNSEKNTTMIIDIGAKKSSIFLFENRISKIVRYSNIGGDDFTESLMKKFKIPFNDAEVLKKKSELPLSKSASHNHKLDTLITVASKLAEEINRSITYHHTQKNSTNINQLYLTGGGSNLTNLDKYLNKELEIPVTKIDLSKNIKNKGTKDINRKYSSVIGLALREI